MSIFDVGVTAPRGWVSLSAAAVDDELLAVPARDLFQLLPVKELLVGGGQPQEPSRLPAVPEEPLHARRTEEQQQAGFLRIDVERVRDVAGAVYERTSHGIAHVLSVPDTDLAREHDEEFVLRTVNVERRGEPSRRQELQHGEVPIRLRRGRLEHGQAAVEPQGFAIAGAESITTGDQRERHRPILQL